MKKTLIYLLFTFLFAHFLFSVFKPEPAPVAPECPEAVTSKFENLARTEYEEYLRLKSDEARYKKADEILQKIVAIFITDLGIHFQKQTRVNELPPQAGTETKPKLELSLPAPAAKPSPSRPFFTPPSLSEMRNLMSSSAEENFVKKELLQDPKQSLFTAHQISTLDPNLKGCFTGSITYRSKITEEVKLWLGNLTGGPQIRNFKLIFQMNGKPHGHSSGRLQNNFLTLDKSDANEFLLYPLPGKYLQLYFAAARENLIGNEYEQQTNSDYIFNGTVSLHKTTDCGWLREHDWW